jgi:subtilisin family serine protease
MGAVRPAAAAEVAPEVEAAMVAGSPQLVIVHLRTDPAAHEALLRSPGPADLRRLTAVKRILTDATEQLAAEIAAEDLRIRRTFRLQPAFSAEVSAAGVAVLAGHPQVSRVESDRRWEIQTQEGIRLIGADILHGMGISGEGTAVAIVDSGVDYLHPTLGGGQIPNAKVVYGLDTGDQDNDPMDCNGHGTAVASVAAGSSHQWSPSRLFAGGVAPAAKILAYKVTPDSECGVATTGAVVEALEDAILRRQGDDYRLSAINISLGGGAFSGHCDSANLAYAHAVDTAIEAGLTVVAAAGNGGLRDSMNAPGCLSQAISVGSAWDVDPGWVGYAFCLDGECSRSCDDSFRWQRAVACYSNSNAYLDLIAPAEYLKAAAAGSITVDFGGTSGAAAYVTGAVALLHQAHPDLDPTTTRFLLAATGPPTMDDKNGVIRPLVDIAAAVQGVGEVAVSADVGLDILPSPSPPTVSTLFVDGDGPVGNLEVLVDLAHPQPDRLRIVLTAPDGTMAVLHDRGPGSTPLSVSGLRFDGIAGTYPVDLDPLDSLGLFSEKPKGGTWRLTIEDLGTEAFDTEQPRLIGWALSIDEPVQPTPDEISMVFPVVAHAEGANDTSWRSDVRLFNASGRDEISARLFLAPSEPDTGTFRQTDVLVPHGSAVALDDVVADRFGLDTAHGALLVQDPSLSLAHGTSRTYTTSDTGTFGQFIAPTVHESPSTGAGEAALVILPTGGEGHRVNIGFTEVVGESAVVAITLIDGSSGVVLRPSSFHELGPFANVQINSLLPDPELDPIGEPYLRVAVVQGEGRVSAYASVVDNLSGDAVYISGMTPEVTPYLMIPVVARVYGQAGTDWRSDLRVLNHGSFSLHVEAELRFQGALGLPPVIESFELQPGAVLTVDDVVGSLYGFNDAAGSLRLVPREGSAALCAASRTANHVAGGTYGQFVPAIGPDRGLRQRGVLLHLEGGPTNRSNVGINETAGQSVTVEFQLRDHLGKPLGNPRQTTLGPWDSVQINDIFTYFGASPQSNVLLHLTRISGAGSFFAYASVVDADSGDAIFVPVLPNSN